ncbi:S-layer homology domain-containing protein [Paenibacillus sp. OV219]|uniref:S-layer homology domain-containing protein n=1 Tax=Paenibacillus sp. OV219 TaxID=1884377 RepID=UPI0008AD4B67|nr:S-layer homology domain-containing protein [Paenibacillus sp. OV219]SEM77814.1 S-layer homology domain-containing protein [Paenibacillus sp. OV219]
MPQQKKWVKAVSSIMVFSLLTGFSAVGSTLAHAEASSVVTKFSDVPSGHWAEKHIAKLAMQGIIKGTNGAFKPADNVSQQEAVALAIRFIGKEQEVKTDEAIVFPENFEVSTYFKPYIILAFQLGLLDQTEEFKQAEAESTSQWGLKKASREWITKLIVKAIEKQKTADELASSPVSFKDASKIDDGYAGYINAAVSLGLIKGMTADTFDPQGFITRASIATIFSRAEVQFPVSYIGQYTAILTSANASALHLFANDKDSTLDLTPDTYVYRFDSEKLATVSQLTPNTKLLVIADGTKPLYVEQLDDKAQVATVSGTVDRLLPNDNKIWIWSNDEPIPITYNSATKVTDGSGNAVAVSSLTADSQVEVTQDTYRAKPIAIAIKVKSAPVNKTGQGTIGAISSSQLTIQDNDSDTTSMYQAAPQVDVIWQGQILDGGLSALRVGDVVTYEVKNSLITKVTILKTSAKLVRGEFYTVSSDGKIISYISTNGSGKPEAKFVSASVDVTIDGLSDTTISDLVKGDVLDITLNDQDEVVAIKVVNRKVEVLGGATVVSYDADLKALLLKSSTGALVSVYLSDETRFETNGTPLTLSAASTLFVKNKKLTIGYTNDKAIFIQFVYKYSGTATSINTSLKQVTLAQSNGLTVTLPMDTVSSVEINGKVAATLSDVTAGDTVTAVLNANQDKIILLQVHTTKQAQVTAVDTAGKKLILKSSDGIVYNIGTTALDMTNEAGDKLTLASFKAGQTVNLNYVGATIASVKIVNVTTGRVTAVTTDRVSVVDYSGNAVDVQLGTGFSVLKNGSTSSSTSVLAVGDRVEVKKNVKGNVVVTAYSGISKTFWKYNATNGELSVKRATLDDANTYTVTAATKVMQAGSVIPISQLVDGDSIMLYVYQNTIIEIEKL